MANDPLSRVASWLTPASADVTDKPPSTSVAVEDPVLALIAEKERLDALWGAAQDRGEKIFNTLPDDIREGRVRRVSFSDSERGALLQNRRSGFTSEAQLHEWVRVHRRCATVYERFDVEKGRIGAAALTAAEAEFDREIGLDQALAQFRAGFEEIKIIREASGCEGHYREAEDLAQQADEVGNQISNTKPVSLAGAIAMLELGLAASYVGEDLTNAVIAGLRDMQPEAAGETAGDPLPIDTAPIKPDEEFRCLLWAPPWRAAANKLPFWHLGRWDGENWCDDHAGIIFPTHWHPLPKPGPIAEHRSWREQYRQLLAKPDAIGFGEPEEGGAA